MAVDTADFAASIQPRLVSHARYQLRGAGITPDLGEDIVQEAWVRWLTAQPVHVEAWMRKCIRLLVIDRVRRQAGNPRGGRVDPLDMQPLSLSEEPL